MSDQEKIQVVLEKIPGMIEVEIGGKVVIEEPEPDSLMMFYPLLWRGEVNGKEAAPKYQIPLSMLELHLDPARYITDYVVWKVRELTLDTDSGKC